MPRAIKGLKILTLQESVVKRGTNRMIGEHLPASGLWRDNVVWTDLYRDLAAEVTPARHTRGHASLHHSIPPLQTKIDRYLKQIHIKHLTKESDYYIKE